MSVAFAVHSGRASGVLRLCIGPSDLQLGVAFWGVTTHCFPSICVHGFGSRWTEARRDAVTLARGTTSWHASSAAGPTRTWAHLGGRGLAASPTGVSEEGSSQFP